MAILLNPGPVSLSERVRKALLRPDICHREAEFSELQTAIRHKLLRVYGLDERTWSAVLLTGSGTAAVEAMLTSLIPADGRVLILANGVYGERMAKMAAVHGIDHTLLKQDWGGTIDLDAAGEIIAGGNISHVAMVHLETTTGRLNDLDGVARLARDGGCRLLIDGVSSFGAEAIEFGNDGIDACAATANKCLHGVPGISFVIVRRTALAAGHARTVYLDLAGYAAEQDRRGTPFTPSVQCCYALDEALDEFAEEGGWEERRRRYRSRMQIVRDGLTGLGIAPLLEDGASSCVLNAFRLPTGMTYAALHDGLKEAGFVIYAGQGGFAEAMFRIAVMGEIPAKELERLISATAALLPRPLSMGSANRNSFSRQARD